MQARTLRAFTALFAFLTAAAFAVPMGTDLSDIVFVDGKTGSDTNNGSMFFPYKTVTNAFARHADSEYLEIVFGSRPNGNVHVSRTNTAFSGPKGMKIANLYLDNENVRIVLDGVGARYLHVPPNTNDTGSSRAIVTLLNGAEVDDIGSGPDTSVTIYSSGYARQYSTNFTDVISLPLVDAASVRSSNTWWWATNTTTVKDALDRLGNIVPVPDDMSATNLYMMWDKDAAMWTWTDALTPYWTSNSVMHWVLDQAYASLYTLTNDYGTKAWTEAWVSSNAVSATELADYAPLSYVSSNYVLKSSMTNYLQNDYTNTVNGQIQTNISDLSNNLLTVIGEVSTNVSDLSDVLGGITNNVFVQATKSNETTAVAGNVGVSGSLSVGGQLGVGGNLTAQTNFTATNGLSSFNDVSVSGHIGLGGTNISTWSDITSGFEDQVSGLGMVVTQNWYNTTNALYSVSNKLGDHWVAITNLSGEVWTNNRNSTNWIHVLSNRVNNATNWIHVLSNRVNNATGTVGWVMNSLAFVSNRLAGLTTTGAVSDLNVKMEWVISSLGSVSNRLTNTIYNLASVSNRLDWVTNSLDSVSNMLTGSNFTWSGEGPFTINPGGESPTNFWIGTNNLYGWFMSWAGGAGGGGEGSGDQGDSTNPPVIITGDYLSLTGGVLRGPLVIGSNSTMDAAGYNAFVHGSGSSAAGSNAFASGFDASAPGNSAHAIGWNVTATGSASIAAGVLAKATNDNAFVWSGIVQDGTVPTQYPSHGQGSFSINPVPLDPGLGPLSGFWVGETNMAVLINSLTPLQSFTDFTNSISANLTNFATVGALTNLSNIVAGIIASNEQQVVSDDYLPLTGGTVTGKVTIVATGSGDAFAADGKASFTGQAFLQGHTNTAVGFSHAEGANNQVSGSSFYSHAEGVDNSVVDAIGSHVEGFHNAVSSSYTHVSGTHAGSASGASNSFVWSGVPSGWYSGLQPGSFNINPKGGLAGVWIGTTNLLKHIQNVAGSGSGGGGGTQPVGKAKGIGVFAVSINNTLTTNEYIVQEDDGWTCSVISNAQRYIILGYSSDYIMKHITGAGSTIAVDAHVRTFNPATNDISMTLAIWLSDVSDSWGSEPDSTITVAKSSANTKYSKNVPNGYGSDVYVKFTCTNATPVEPDTPSGGDDTPAISSSGDLVVTNSITLVTNGVRAVTNIGSGSFAQGRDVAATAQGSFAAGIHAHSTQNFAFVWSGTSDGTSHGTQTFNVNPLNGINGFWIGDDRLSWWMTNIAQNVVSSSGGGSGGEGGETVVTIPEEVEKLGVSQNFAAAYVSGSPCASNNSVALGYDARATNANSFVWSGQTEDAAPSPADGSFSLYPAGGMSNVFISGQSLQDYITAVVNTAVSNAMGTNGSVYPSGGDYTPGEISANGIISVRCVEDLPDVKWNDIASDSYGSNVVFASDGAGLWSGTANGTNMQYAKEQQVYETSWKSADITGDGSLAVAVPSSGYAAIREGASSSFTPKTDDVGYGSQNWQKCAVAETGNHVVFVTDTDDRVAFKNGMPVDDTAVYVVTASMIVTNNNQTSYEIPNNRWTDPLLYSYSSVTEDVEVTTAFVYCWCTNGAVPSYPPTDYVTTLRPDHLISYSFDSNAVVMATAAADAWHADITKTPAGTRYSNLWVSCATVARIDWTNVVVIPSNRWSMPMLLSAAEVPDTTNFFLYKRMFIDENVAGPGFTGTYNYSTSSVVSNGWAVNAPAIQNWQLYSMPNAYYSNTNTMYYGGTYNTSADYSDVSKSTYGSLFLSDERSGRVLFVETNGAPKPLMYTPNVASKIEINPAYPVQVSVSGPISNLWYTNGIGKVASYATYADFNADRTYVYISSNYRTVHTNIIKTAGNCVFLHNSVLRSYSNSNSIYAVKPTTYYHVGEPSDCRYAKELADSACVTELPNGTKVTNVGSYATGWIWYASRSSDCNFPRYTNGVNVANYFDTAPCTPIYNDYSDGKGEMVGSLINIVEWETPTTNFIQAPCGSTNGGMSSTIKIYWGQKDYNKLVVDHIYGVRTNVTETYWETMGTFNNPTPQWNHLMYTVNTPTNYSYTGTFAKHTNTYSFSNCTDFAVVYDSSKAEGVKYIVAGSDDGYLYVNSGEGYSMQETPGQNNWTQLVCSTNGNNVIAIGSSLTTTTVNGDEIQVNAWHYNPNSLTPWKPIPGIMRGSNQSDYYFIKWSKAYIAGNKCYMVPEYTGRTDSHVWVFDLQ